MSWMEWYQSLAKPEWTPAPSTISLMWQILYPIIVITFGYVFVQVARRKWPVRVAIPFAINLVANLSFTPLMFGLQSLPLATIDILIVWSTIIWMMIVVWSSSRWIALVQLPYLTWVSIATVLQLSITAMNWSRI
ncbi:TspO/MBR family protein [Rubinisphaera margarita]|uniref:TspO/MBR family protein n=1 Tax=Rubinisphaera margarita TaxID=2909586 RepID=UPI001EE7C794|nr:TspO/MBR family protein [Rubinisphaera margarita]MCG6155317.1 tryptophan-rich sensory protein [Rubinisphaera margarita]